MSTSSIVFDYPDSRCMTPICMYNNNNENIPPQNTKIEITNTKIIHFYKSHPHINIEEVNLQLINLINTTSKGVYEPTSLLQETIEKIQIQKQPYINIISKLFPMADIRSITNDDNNICIKRFKKAKIIVRMYDTESNISNEQVTDFMNSIDEENSCGIILSQKSGITNKKNFQIDIHNNNILISVHNVNYSHYIIESAIDIIDTLYEKMQSFSKESGNHYTISTELLDNINNEYQLFIGKKNSMVETMKEFQKKMLSQLEECKFTSLSNILSEKYSVYSHSSKFICDLCKNYSGHNLKPLAAHKRGCLRKKSII